MARTTTPDRINENGSRTVTVQRCCNGCGKSLGDATESELNLAITRGSLPDVREECGCVPAAPKPILGSTCTVGNGKTRWEVIRVEADGTLHLSRVGGDGYTNRWAKPDEVRNVQTQTLTHTLGEVLNARQEVATTAASLADQVKRHAKPLAIAQLLGLVFVRTNRYIRIYKGHLTEIQSQEGTQA